MFKLDNKFLTEIGLGALPAAEKNKMLAHIYETLEMRVGMKLAEKMSNEQLDEFEAFIKNNNEAGALQWLESNFPNYKQVVAEELEKLKAEISKTAPQILAQSAVGPSSQQGASASRPAQVSPPRPQGQVPQEAQIVPQQPVTAPDNAVSQQPPQYSQQPPSQPTQPTQSQQLFTPTPAPQQSSPQFPQQPPQQPQVSVQSTSPQTSQATQPLQQTQANYQQQATPTQQPAPHQPILNPVPQQYQQDTQESVQMPPQPQPQPSQTPSTDSSTSSVSSVQPAQPTNTNEGQPPVIPYQPPVQ